MKKLYLLILTLCSMAAVQASDKVVEFKTGLTIDRSVDADSTFQEVPDLGPGKFICLWNGDVLQASIMTGFDKFKGSVDEYMAHTKRVAEGADKDASVKLTPGSRFLNDQNIEIRRFDMIFNQGEISNKQYFYAIGITSGYHFIVVSLNVPDAYESIGSRADKLLKSSKLLKKAN